MGSWHRRLEAQGPDREALIFEGRRLSYAEIALQAGDLSRRLATIGVRAGDRVALLAPPSAEGVALIHALLDQGIVMVPLNLRWTETEWSYALGAARVDWLVVTEELAAVGARLSARLECGLLRLGSAADLAPRLDRVGAPRSRADAERSARRERMRAVGAALVLFTSGTSGRPKGAVLSLRNLCASAAGSIALLGAQPEDRWLCCMPLFHVGGLSILIRSALAGTPVVLHPRFDAEAVSASLEQDGVTRISLVATMLARLIEVRGARPAPEALSLVLLGGGPASRELLERARSLGYPIAPTYGLTEAASQVATRPPQAEVRGATDLTGGMVPLPGVEIRIVDARGERMAVDTVGEIEVRGATVMQGYLDELEDLAPGASSQRGPEAWLATGDLGRIDAQGGLRVLDRRSDLIVSGGENVYPAEVESVLAEHPDIAEAGVIGVEDADYGQRPMAFIVAKTGRRLDPVEVSTFCHRHLARYKVPAELIVVDALPRNASGKLLRRELADRRRALRER